MGAGYGVRQATGRASADSNLDIQGDSMPQQTHGWEGSTDGLGAPRDVACLPFGPTTERQGRVRDPAWLRTHWCDLTRKAVMLAKRMGLDAEDGEDALTEAYLIVWRSESTPESPLPYILGVTRGVLRNHRRVRDLREKLLHQWSFTAPDDCADAEQSVAAAELLRRVQQHLASLDARQAEIFMSVMLAEEPASSVSRVHPEGSARVRQVMCRIRRKLHEDLSR